MTIKIEFPADNLEAAKHLGAALTAYGHGMKDGGVHTLEAGEVLPGAAIEQTAATEDRINKFIDGAEEAVVITKTANVGITTAQTAAADNARLDEHGVSFNPDMCGTAAIPFYASGPNVGQWKKLRGVDQAEYDTWYADAKPPAQPGDAEPVNTAGAFQPDGDNTNNDPTVPHDAGTLMAWVAGMQGAGRLTQDQVNSAYTQAELVMPDIFPTADNTPDVIAERVGKLYLILSAWA